MRTPKKITAEWLREHGACGEEVGPFEEMWPKGAPITLRRLVRYADERGHAGLEWLAWRLFSDKERARWQGLREPELQTCCDTQENESIPKSIKYTLRDASDRKDARELWRILEERNTRRTQ